MLDAVLVEQGVDTAEEIRELSLRRNQARAGWHSNGTRMATQTASDGRRGGN